MKVKTMLAGLFCILTLTGFSIQSAKSPDNEGFIRNWLVLAPIPYEGEDNGATEIGREQIKDEGRIQPKAGDKVIINKKEYAWMDHQTDDYFIDFAKLSGAGPTEDVIGYAVAYVAAPEEMKDIKLKIGSNDQARVYLNRKAVLTFDDTRTLEKDQNEAVVTLNKGVNTIVFKVINQKNNWQACLRFTDAKGAPVKNLKLSTSL